MELMREKFAKLLLGEDMSGGGKGVSSALALSNAITNLAGNCNYTRPEAVYIYYTGPFLYDNSFYLRILFFFENAASVFGEQKRLEPMPADRKAKWRREIDWLLSVTDHVVEFVPSKQISKDGTSMEVTLPETPLHVYHISS